MVAQHSLGPADMEINTTLCFAWCYQDAIESTFFYLLPGTARWVYNIWHQKTLIAMMLCLESRAMWEVSENSFLALGMSFSNTAWGYLSWNLFCWWLLQTPPYPLQKRFFVAHLHVLMAKDCRPWIWNLKTGNWAIFSEWTIGLWIDRSAIQFRTLVPCC